MKISEHYDIVFLGGRLSGGLGARFLKKNFKDKKILVLEKNEKLNWCAGESTVGVAGLFLIRELGLSTYCYLNHLPKNGLRFIFDDSNKPFSVETCSEIGANMLPVFPTFQIDRARLDMDLWELNREIGIDVLTGVEVNDIKVNPNGNHEVSFVREGQKIKVSCEWIVNSTGRYSSLNEFFKDSNPIVSQGYLNTASAWGRFTDVTDIDLLGDEKWREKAGFSSRYLSTTHFMKEGSWTWQIPIDRDVVSFGIVYDKSIVTDNTETEEGFLKLIKKNPFVNKLLENAKLLDFQRNSALDFRRKYFALPEKVIFLGEAFGFVDPFYSQGSDIISRECYMMKNLIEAGENYEHRRNVINQFITNEFEYINILYKDQYQAFGSFNVYNIKSKWDFYCYTNRLVWLFYSKKYADFNWIENEIENHFLTVKLTKAIQNGFIELNHHLRSINEYESGNTNNYSVKQNRFVFEEMIIASKYNDKFARQNHYSICMLTICELLEMRFKIKNLVNNKLIQQNMTLASITEFELSEKWFKEFLANISQNLKKILVQKGIIEPESEFMLSIEDFKEGHFQRAEFSAKVNTEISTMVFEQKYNHVQFQLDHLDEAARSYL